MMMKKTEPLMLGACLLIIIFSSYCDASDKSETPFPRENAVVRAVKLVSKAVVNISSEYEVRNRVNPFFNAPLNSFFKDFFDYGFETQRKVTSLGSGVIIDGKRGLILTNEHVISQSQTITVMLSDGREFKADIVGTDPESDLAVLRIAADILLPAIEMGDSGDIMIGETVIAIGNPFGFSNTVTTGVVSATNRSVKTDNQFFYNFIQTDASINPGNSGGPLLNINGELIGINTAIYAKAEGIGFAIPINKAKKIISDLIAYGEVVHVWIGVTVQNIDNHLAGYLNLPKEYGVVVKDVEPAGPAAKAGIREGDILIGIGEIKTGSTGGYENAMRSFREGDEMQLHVVRDGDEFKIPVTASVFPEKLAMKLAFRLMGVQVIDIDQAGRYRYRVSAPFGVIISEMDSHSVLAWINVRPGDVIRQMNEISIRNTDDFKKAIIKYRWKESVVILLQRGDDGYYITVQF